MAYFTINGYDSYSGCDIVVTASFPIKTTDGEDIYFTLGSLQTLSVSTHQDKRPVRSLGNINAKDYVMGQRTIAGSLVFAVFDRHFADKIMKSAGVLMADEIPALNLTINFANEYGRSSRMAIYGVKLLNEGQVMSINDLYTENTYQFVALGMEPLEADEINDEQGSGGSKGGSSSSGSKNYQYLPSGGVYQPTDPKLEVIESKEFKDSSGKEISDKIKNNADYQNKESIVISSSVEQPIDGETTGIVTINLTPVQYEGYIYITNLLSGALEHTITVNGSESYNIDLPIGHYNARYMNTTRTRESNIGKISVKITQSSEELRSIRIANEEAYPVIESVSNDTITVTMRNSNFSNVICYSSGDVEADKISSGDTTTFINLKSDTEYKIYAVNDSNNKESNMVSAKTFPDKNSYYNKFKEFLKANRSMLQNDYDSMIKELETLIKIDHISNTKTWPFNNIIDGINVLDNSLVKQELLLYAMSFENSMNEAYNMKNPYKINIVRNDIFDTEFSSGEWESIKCYSKKGDKNKLEDVLTGDKVFNGQPNKAYSLYGLDRTNSSIKHYVSVFSAEGKEFLSKYKEINKYKSLDLGYNKALHPSLDIDELYAMTIRDNLFCDRQLLDEPYVYIEDDKVYADVNYDDKMLLDDMYYLCISEMYDTLDNTPKRKEPFNRQTKIINLNNVYVPFDSNKIYHCWIENSLGNIISKAFVFNYKQSQGLERALDKELMNDLNIKKRLLYDVISNHNAVNDIIYNLYCETVPKKDIDTKLEYAMLEYGKTSKLASNALEDYLYPTVLTNVSSKLNINRANKITLYKKNKQILVRSGSDLDTKVLVKSYNLLEQETTCTIHNVNTMIDIKGDFVSVFLINEYVDKIIGFVVIDCGNFKYKELGFEVKVGDK